jgi:single-strand DNA-binding protein
MAKSKNTEAPAKEAPAAEEIFLSYNRVELGGRCVADAELRYTPKGKAVCSFRIATNDTRTAEFHSVVAWEDVAEAAAEHLKKGSPVYVEGRLQTRTWDAPDGSKRRATEVIANSVRAA